LAEPCPRCGHEYGPHRDRCEVCGLDVGAPNVRAANEPEEVQALEQRYAAAVADARGRGCQEVVERFEQQAAASKAVLCKHFSDVYGLAAKGSGSWLILTYQDQVRAGRPPDAPEWARRRILEERWFTNYTEEIHYGALSLTDSGMSGYGEVSLVFREVAIEDRASVGEGNAVTFAQGIPLDDPLPPGHRAAWKLRGKLCVAKLSERLQADTEASAFAGILLSAAHDRSSPDFVEVHVYGALTLESFDRVRVPRKYDVAPFNEVWDKLRARNVGVEFYDEAAP
jgi:hypothetical protein